MSNVWVEQRAAMQERVAAEQARGDGTTYWAKIERLANGEILQQKTTDARVARGWHAETHLRVREYGDGVPPWELPSQHAPVTSQTSAPAAPEVIDCDVASSVAAAPIIEDPIASFERAVGRPEKPVPMLAPATTTQTPPAPPGGAGRPSASTDPNVVNLAELIAGEDLRIASAAKRIKKYMAENARGVYRPPRFSRSTPKPDPGPGF